MLFHKALDALYRIEQGADCSIVVERIDQICNVFAHIDLDVPRLGCKLGTAINQVGGENQTHPPLLPGRTYQSPR